MRWHAASGVAAGLMIRGDLNDTRGGDSSGVVAAVAVRDEMKKKKENLSKCFVEPSGSQVGRAATGRLGAPCTQSGSGR